MWGKKKIKPVYPEGKIKREFIGVWEFVVLKDEYGRKIDTIRHGMGYEIPKGPLITLRKNGTYSKMFTPKNTDNGKWFFDEKTNSIKYLLYYDKPYDFVEQDLINRGHAKKDENGEYYEIITDKVFENSKTELTLIERENRRRTFKKIAK